jgi:hypothetical protein
MQLGIVQIALLLIVSQAAFAIPCKVPTHLYSNWGTEAGHPGHDPLITHLTFRSICNHVIDQSTEWFNPEEVQQGDTIFLNLWYLDWFETEIHDQIRYPYILISCDVGNWFPDPRIQKLLYDPKLAAWFCRNIIFSDHPKLFQIPIGQTERYFGDEWLTYLKNLIGQTPFPKQHLLYMNHFPRSKGDRDKIVKLFENEDFCFSRNHENQQYDHIPKGAYYEEVALSQFCISPLGLETDCVRTWESVALDCIPIVEHSFLDSLYEDLPILIIHDWTQINRSFLIEKYEELKGRKKDKGYFAYWRTTIQETQNKVRNNELSFCQLEATQFDCQGLIEILKEEENPFLIYKGFLTTLHSLQIVNSAPFLLKIYLRDPWLKEESLVRFQGYLSDSEILANKQKIFIISENQFNNECINYDPFISGQFSPIFLDLTYYRNSLLPIFREDQMKDFRHNLRNDLEDLYKKMGPGALLCGNGMEHTYVAEVLENLSKKYDLNIGKKGNYWFLKKSRSL